MRNFCVNFRYFFLLLGSIHRGRLHVVCDRLHELRELRLEEVDLGLLCLECRLLLALEALESLEFFALCINGELVSLQGPSEWISMRLTFVSAVVPGVESTIDVGCCVIAFITDDLPAFMNPTIEMFVLGSCGAFAKYLPIEESIFFILFSITPRNTKGDDTESSALHFF